MLNTTRFQFIADALHGQGRFAPTVAYDSDGHATSVGATALIRYPRESLDKFARRVEVAWYENHILSACQRFVGYLAKKPPLREIGNPLLEDFAADCDWRGNSLDVFWQSFMVEAKARGSMLLLVDMPRMEPASLAEQVEARYFPYLSTIAPEHVVNYELDQRGRVAMVEWHIQHDGKLAIKGFDTERWWIRAGEKIIVEDDHGLGLCPVIAFSESVDFPWVGDFAQIADMSRRMYNARSELDEILRAQTFSLLHYHVPQDQHDFNVSTVAEAIGTHNMLIHRGDAPGFIAPESGPAEVYLATIAKLEEAIKRVGLVVEAPEQQQAESGIALTIRFQALNSALTGFARRMEDFERRMWEVACAWLSLDVSRARVEWAKDYALADLKTEMEVLASMQMSAFPAEAIRQQQKHIAALAFSAAEPDTMAAVIEAIDEGGAEIPATDTGDAGQDAVAVDLSPIESRLAAIEAAITAEQRPEPAPPVNNITVEIQPGAIAPAIQIDQPASPPAPMVDLSGVTDRLAALESIMTRQAAPLPAPQPLVINNGSGAKIIDLNRDASGSITGATVREGAA